jgi:hypothetical protein
MLLELQLVFGWTQKTPKGCLLCVTRAAAQHTDRSGQLLTGVLVNTTRLIRSSKI